MKRLLATSLFAAGAYSLSLLAGTPGVSADGSAGVVTTPPSALLSPATAALADGDDIPARFMFETTTNGLSAATGATAAPDVAVLSPATAALADGDDIRARFIFEGTSNRLSSATGATAAPDGAAVFMGMAAFADGVDIRARALAAIQH